MHVTAGKILVIDDLATMTRIIKKLALKAGFTDVDVCHDGETGLRMLQESEYQFVLCDLEMQPMNGAEFVRRAREESFGSRCSIVLITASRESAARAMGADLTMLVDGLLMKPFNSKVLRTKLEQIAEVGRSRSRP